MSWVMSTTPLPSSAMGPEHGQGFLRLLQAHARGGLVGDDQPGAGEQSCGHQNPPGHAAGELEGVQPFRLLRQTKPAEELPAALCGPGLPVAIHLGSHLHQGVQKGHGLGNQGDFGPPELGLPFRGQRFSVKP